MTLREKDPGRGKLDLPGGFGDPGEGAIEGFRRECREELGWDPGPEPTLFASFPNIYPYKGISYRTCDLFFRVDAPDLSEKDLQLEPQEITGIRFVPLQALDPNAIAFDSVRRALAFFAENYNR
jgi:8-oxo-dGTP pyrophosphatase MutT (NUDIX family)